MIMITLTCIVKGTKQERHAKLNIKSAKNKY